MKVLAAIVVPPHLSVSGGARAAEALSAALAEHCDITVASMLGAIGMQGEGGNARRVDVRVGLPAPLGWSGVPNKLRTLFYRSNLADIVSTGDWDLVHIHNPLPALEMARVAQACRARGIAYVVSTHGFNEVANGGAVYGFDGTRRFVWQRLVETPVRRVVAGASGIFALSPADFEIVREMGYTGSDLSIVTNGVPTPQVHDDTCDAAALGELGIPQARASGEITAMFLANHTPNKGLPILLEAFCGLDRPFLLIIGGEKRPEIDYDRYLRALKPGQQIVVTGRLSDAAVHAIFRRSDLFVFPTLADTFPLAVLEAMAHGVPVVASRVGGIPYQITDDCGVVVEPRDVAGLRAVINRLAQDPQLVAQMGRAARQRAQDTFTWTKAAEAALKGYRSVLARQRRGTTGARASGQAAALVQTKTTKVSIS